MAEEGGEGRKEEKGRGGGGDGWRREGGRRTIEEVLSWQTTCHFQSRKKLLLDIFEAFKAHAGEKPRLRANLSGTKGR